MFSSYDKKKLITTFFYMHRLQSKIIFSVNFNYIKRYDKLNKYPNNINIKLTKNKSVCSHSEGCLLEFPSISCVIAQLYFN